MTRWERTRAVVGERGMERVWAAEGGYPQVSVTLSSEFLGEPGVRISTDRKDHVGHWWYQANLPVELVPELIEMLQELMATPGKGKPCT